MALWDPSDDLLHPDAMYEERQSYLQSNIDLFAFFLGDCILKEM